MNKMQNLLFYLKIAGIQAHYDKYFKEIKVEYLGEKYEIQSQNNRAYEGFGGFLIIDEFGTHTIFKKNKGVVDFFKSLKKTM